MQLIVGLRNLWKCVEISLQDGYIPVIGGVALPECNIEPALWFKVLVLDSLCVDCSEHVISWIARDASRGGGEGASQPRPTHCRTISLQPASSIPGPLLFSPNPLHSLMAPHEEGVSSYQDDLRSLFELAELLFHSSPPPPSSSSSSSSSTATNATITNATAATISRDRSVDEHSEEKAWLRLLHCFLLPPISLHCEDVPALQHAMAAHSHTVAALDTSIMDSSTMAMELKGLLDGLREKLVPTIDQCARRGLCSAQFLTYLTSDLRNMEEVARVKIVSASCNLMLSSSSSSSPSGETEESLQTQRREAERELMDTLSLRASLEQELFMSHTHTTELSEGELPMSAADQREMKSVMERYIACHRRLAVAREVVSQLSRKKVLALSVREAMEQTLETVKGGRASTGVDAGLQGGHSTDVLSEASQYTATDEYSTFSDEMKQLMQLGSSSPASKMHHMFVSFIQTEWFPDTCDGFLLVSQDVKLASLSDTQEQSGSWRRRFTMRRRRRSAMDLPLVPTTVKQASQQVHQHFQEIVTAICDHFGNHDADFRQKAWICYEKLFFETCSDKFMSCYQTEHTKLVERLWLNALNASVISPSYLGLGIPDNDWVEMFAPRPFEVARSIFSEGQSASDYMTSIQMAPLVKASFGAVTSDLYSMTDIKAPLEKLQLLTSAFRKTMAALSDLKLKFLLEKGSSEYGLAGVSCDDLLPILVLLLLQLHPSFLTSLWLHCSFLEDFTPPFAEMGWHGYSLATFRSALKVISEL